MILKSVIMSKKWKALLFIFICLYDNIQCHELLMDFLDFQDQNSQTQLTQTCANNLKLVQDGIKENKVWALKGKTQGQFEIFFIICDNFSPRCKWQENLGFYMGK